MYFLVSIGKFLSVYDFTKLDLTRTPPRAIKEIGAQIFACLISVESFSLLLAVLQSGSNGKHLIESKFLNFGKSQNLSFKHNPNDLYAVIGAFFVSHVKNKQDSPDILILFLDKFSECEKTKLLEIVELIVSFNTQPILTQARGKKNKEIGFIEYMNIRYFSETKSPWSGCSEFENTFIAYIDPSHYETLSGKIMAGDIGFIFSQGKNLLKNFTFRTSVIILEKLNEFLSSLYPNQHEFD